MNYVLRQVESSAENIAATFMESPSYIVDRI